MRLKELLMRPDELVEYSRRTYSNPRSIEGWASEDLVASGLYPQEQVLFERIAYKKGRILLLGVGGGREAVPVVQKGFEVTGVDFIPELVERARQNLSKRNVEMEGLIQEISELDVPPASFDIVWFTTDMYSYIPTKKRCLKMLEKIRRAMKPDGVFICQFYCEPTLAFSPVAEIAKRAFGILTWGNLWYEMGKKRIKRITGIYWVF